MVVRIRLRLATAVTVIQRVHLLCNSRFSVRRGWRGSADTRPARRKIRDRRPAGSRREFGHVIILCATMSIPRLLLYSRVQQVAASTCRRRYQKIVRLPAAVVVHRFRVQGARVAKISRENRHVVV